MSRTYRQAQNTKRQAKKRLREGFGLSPRQFEKMKRAVRKAMKEDAERDLSRP